ncbi:group III truncated hemoglobin [Oricola sp.]|uniref:group III truncated hemoglobin n=1 Tax=Oricola sp. TaxID=1979950 RepID=UPI003BA9CDCB
MSKTENLPSPGVAAGITEAMIERLVHEFYSRVRKDKLLGPVFEAIVEEWDDHLRKLCDFWSSVALLSGRYKGTPMQAHAAIGNISAQHFDRWLELFSATASDTCPQAAAVFFNDRAGRIAQSLERGIAVHRGDILGAGARLGSARGTPANG